MIIIYNNYGDFMNVLKKCNLCPRNCLVNRYEKKGFCNANEKIKVALAKPFYYEEPPISGTKGSGTIFFSSCNLKCLFCQNEQISQKCFGKEISITTLANIMLDLQEKKVHNINLVTPTMYIPQIAKAIKKAKNLGLTIPIVYNSNAYENPLALKLLDGLIDIYLPDFKYYNDSYAIKYSKAPNYSKSAMMAIKEMYRQVGNPLFDDNGIMQKGVIVRHLMLPGLKEDTKKILSYLYQEYHDNIFISIMNQYTPMGNIPDEINKKVDEVDYDEIIDYALDIGINNAFCQTGGTVSESFIPSFNLEGIKK